MEKMIMAGKKWIKRKKSSEQERNKGNEADTKKKRPNKNYRTCMVSLRYHPMHKHKQPQNVERKPPV